MRFRRPSAPSFVGPEWRCRWPPPNCATMSVVGALLLLAVPGDLLRKFMKLNRGLAQLFRLDFVETPAVVAAFGKQFGGLDSF